MTWTVNVSHKASKAIEKLDSPTKLKIQHFLNHLLPNLDNPRSVGKALQGELKGLWRYRVGDYRLITQIQDKEVVILVVEIGHRKNIYK